LRNFNKINRKFGENGKLEKSENPKGNFKKIHQIFNNFEKLNKTHKD
jgi:hypothetical protein